MTSGPSIVIEKLGGVLRSGHHPHSEEFAAAATEAIAALSLEERTRATETLQSLLHALTGQPPVAMGAPAAVMGTPVEEEPAELAMLRPGGGGYPCVLARTLTGVHTGNITSVRWAPGDRLVSGGADRLLVVSDATGGRSSATFDAGVLCVEVHAESATVAASAMDGSVAIFQLDADDGRLSELFRARSHRKYAHGLRWHPSGRLLASCSFDHTLVVYHKRGDTWSQLEQLHCGATVEAVEWLAPAPTGLALPQAPLLAAAVRDDHRLHLIEVHVDRPAQDRLSRRVLNLNANGDDTHSFNVLALAASPDGRWLAAATDSGRVLVLGAQTGRQMRALCTGVADDLMQPRPALAWDASGKYLTASSAGQEGLLQVWDLATEAPVAQLQGHTAQVRDLHLHPTRRVLASAGFDKTIRLWVAAGDGDVKGDQAALAEWATPA